MGENVSDEYVIDLSNIPLTPIGKKDIQRLEMALVIATLYSPEVLELIKDPVERATWVDSLAVAAAALAREKAGYTIQAIAEEVGRSETSIRAHLSGKTKAGKLVRDVYDKLKRGEYRIIVPFIKAGAEAVLSKEEFEKELSSIKARYEDRIRELEDRVRSLESEINVLRNKLDSASNVLSFVKERIGSIKDIVKEIEEKLS